MFPELFRKLFFEILRLFEFADLVFTVFAFQRIVGPLPELFRMFEQRDLPAQHQHNTGKEQAPVPLNISIFRVDCIPASRMRASLAHF